MVYCFYKIALSFYEFTGTINHRVLTNQERAYYFSYFIIGEYSSYVIKFFFSLLNVYCCKIAFRKVMVVFYSAWKSPKRSLIKHVAMHILDNVRVIEK